MTENQNNPQEEQDQQPDTAEELAGLASQRSDEFFFKNEKESDPQDALSALDRGRKDAVGGLDQLSRGEDPGAAAEAAAAARSQAGAGTPGQANPAAAAAEAAPGGQPLAGERPASDQPARPNAARQAQAQARAHAHSYKKFMIPLLLVVGGLLVLVGLISSGMAFKGAVDESALSDARMGLVAVISFPLAAVLLIGAWWFHRETSR
jgi:uncharacterized membrane protein